MILLDIMCLVREIDYQSSMSSVKYVQRVSIKWQIFFLLRLELPAKTDEPLNVARPIKIENLEKRSLRTT